MRTIVIEVDDTTIVEVYQDPETVVVATQTTPDVVAIEEVQTVVSVEAPVVEAVEISQPPDIVVLVEQSTPSIVEVVSRGPQGPPGDIANGNATAILGYPVRLVDGQRNDLLNFDGTAWTNRPSTDVTDGGNF